MNKKLIIVSGAVVVAGLLIFLMSRGNGTPNQPQPTAVPIETKIAEGSVSDAFGLDRVELSITADQSNPVRGTGQIQVTKLDNRGRRSKIIGSSAPFDIYRPAANQLELKDLNNDSTQEIIASVGTGQDQGELMIYGVRGGSLEWFCSLPERAACIFPYQFNPPEVLDLDSDKIAEVVVYGPQRLSEDDFNFDRYEIYAIYVYQNNAYRQVSGAKLIDLKREFGRQSRLPLVPPPTPDSAVSP